MKIDLVCTRFENCVRMQLHRLGIMPDGVFVDYYIGLGYVRVQATLKEFGHKTRYAVRPRVNRDDELEVNYLDIAKLLAEQITLRTLSEL